MYACISDSCDTNPGQLDVLLNPTDSFLAILNSSLEVLDLSGAIETRLQGSSAEKTHLVLAPVVLLHDVGVGGHFHLELFLISRKIGLPFFGLSLFKLSRLHSITLDGYRTRSLIHGILPAP